MKISLLLVVFSVTFVAYSEAACGFMNIPRPKHAHMDSFSTKHLQAEFSCKGIYIVQTTGKKKQHVKCGRGGWAKPIPCVKPNERIYTHCEAPSQWLKLFSTSFKKGKYPIGAVVQVTCRKHFHLPDGVREVKCEKKGWNVGVNPLKCIRNTCKVPTTWKNTVLNNLNNEYWSGRRILITCPKVEQMVAPLTAKGGIIKCLPDGSWSVKEEELCKSGGKKCDVPKVWKKLFPRLPWRDEYLPGTALILNNCPSGVNASSEMLTTNGVTTCRTGGSWDVETPCKVKDCRIPKSWRMGKEHVTFGEEVKLRTCPPGTRLIHELQSTNGKLVCNAQGTFGIDVTRPPCKPIPMPRAQQQYGGGSQEGTAQRDDNFCINPPLWKQSYPAMAKAGDKVEVGMQNAVGCDKDNGYQMTPGIKKAKGIIKCLPGGIWNVPTTELFCVQAGTDQATGSYNQGNGRYGRRHNSDNGGNTGSAGSSQGKTAPNGACRTPPAWISLFPELREYPIFQNGKGFGVKTCPTGLTFTQQALNVKKSFDCFNGKWNVPKGPMCVRPDGGATGYEQYGKKGGYGQNGKGGGYGRNDGGHGGGQGHSHTRGGVKRCVIPDLWKRAYHVLAKLNSAAIGVTMDIRCAPGSHKTRAVLRVNSKVKCMPNGLWNVPRKVFCEGGDAAPGHNY
ncbi:uncharacterized protein LOC135500462 [Lineus longissimus]|uniref:uncharacterized protein LOC135500462 n=1 Tax=Lineus longissimus TaxID=88925 RepID=UPI002B4EEAB5